MCIHLCAVSSLSGGKKLVYEGTSCLVWGDIFNRRKDRGVVCDGVLLFFTLVGVYVVGVCVCIRTNTHTHCTDWVLGCELRLRGRDETPGGPEEIQMAQSRHIYSYMCTKYTCVMMMIAFTISCG